MHIKFSDDVILDSRRAVLLPRQETLVLADLFLGLGAARRKRPDLVPASQHHEIWERLLGLLDDYQPRGGAPGGHQAQPGPPGRRGRQELRTLFYKLQAHGREVIQVVGHPERAWGPSLENTGIQPTDCYRVGTNTLIHRRRIFVYPRHDPPSGFWINGGLHPLFALPMLGADGGQQWLRYPAFLYTGFALVMPSFVPYAQGWEVMQPERLPKQARAWKVVGDYQLSPISLPDLPPPPENLKTLTRTQAKGKKVAGRTTPEIRKRHFPLSTDFPTGDTAHEGFAVSQVKVPAQTVAKLQPQAMYGAHRKFHEMPRKHLAAVGGGRTIRSLEQGRERRRLFHDLDDRAVLLDPDHIQ